MDPVEQLVQLIKEHVIPQLNALAGKVDDAITENHSLHVAKEKHAGKIFRLEEKIGGLKCEANMNILHGYGSRLAKLEENARLGHIQDSECKAKNKQVEQALHLAKKNKTKNEEQEKRYQEDLREQKDKNQKIINRLWWLIGLVASAAAAGWFNHFFSK